MKKIFISIIAIVFGNLTYAQLNPLSIRAITDSNFASFGTDNPTTGTPLKEATTMMLEKKEDEFALK